MASAIGKSLRMYCKYEDTSDKGVTPSDDIIKKIADVLDVDAGDIFSASRESLLELTDMFREHFGSREKIESDVNRFLNTYGFGNYDEAERAGGELDTFVEKYHIPAKSLQLFYHEWQLVKATIDKFETMERIAREILDKLRSDTPSPTPNE